MKRTKIARAKKSVSSLPHPKDRKVDQFQRKIRRETKLSAQAEARKQAEAAKSSRFFWFRTQMRCLGGNEVSSPVASCLAKLFVARNDDESAVLKKMRNPPKGRIRHLHAIKERELDELSGSKGFLIPDVLTADGVNILTEIWDGELATIGCVPTIFVQQLTDKGAAAALTATLSGQLKPTEVVRDEQVQVTKTSVQLQRFCRAAKIKKSRLSDRTARRTHSAKSTSSIAERNDDRRAKLVLRSKTEAQRRRHAAIAESRGLFK
jgi:hypothetical protein